MNFVEKYVKNTSNLSEDDIQRVNDYAEAAFNRADYHGLLFEVKNTALEFVKFRSAPTRYELIADIFDALMEWDI